MRRVAQRMFGAQGTKVGDGRYRFATFDGPVRPAVPWLGLAAPRAGWPRHEPTPRRRIHRRPTRSTDRARWSSPPRLHRHHRARRAAQQCRVSCSNNLASRSVRVGRQGVARPRTLHGEARRTQPRHVRLQRVPGIVGSVALRPDDVGQPCVRSPPDRARVPGHRPSVFAGVRRSRPAAPPSSSTSNRTQNPDLRHVPHPPRVGLRGPYEPRVQNAYKSCDLGVTAQTPPSPGAGHTCSMAQLDATEGLPEPHPHQPVRYIDRTRAWYSALGYDPYRWPCFTDVPFTPLSKPLAESRLALVTTAAPFQPDLGDQGPDARIQRGGEVLRSVHPSDRRGRRRRSRSTHLTHRLRPQPLQGRRPQ